MEERDCGFNLFLLKSVLRALTVSILRHFSLVQQIVHILLIASGNSFPLHGDDFFVWTYYLLAKNSQNKVLLVELDMFGDDEYPVISVNSERNCFYVSSSIIIQGDFGKL